MIMDKTVNNNNIANPTIDDLNAEKPAENTDNSTKKHQHGVYKMRQ